MKIWKRFTQMMTLLIMFCMIASFSIGWITCMYFTTFTNQRNVMEQIRHITLVIVSRGIRNQYLFGIPNKYYLVLSNGMNIYVRKDEFEVYELNHSYDFEIIEKSVTSQNIRVYKDK